MIEPLLILAGAGLVAIVALAFWAEMQNWIAGVIDRSRQTLGPVGYTLQSVLVLLDKVMVSGQRIVAIVGKVAFREDQTGEITVREEIRTINPQALPTDLLRKIDAGETLHYDL